MSEYISLVEQDRKTYTEILKPKAKRYESMGLSLLKDYLTYDNVVSDVHAYFNYWISVELKEQIFARYITYTEKSGSKYEIRFEDIQIMKPKYMNNGNVYNNTPANSINRKLDYTNTVYATPVSYSRTPDGGYREKERGAPIEIFSYLCPVLSAGCNLYGLSEEELILAGHDPEDPGTWFVKSGNIMIMPYLEKLRTSQIHILPPGAKTDTVPHARQIFVTEVGSIMMKVIQNEMKEVCLSINAFGDNMEKNKKVSRNNSINVIHVAVIIDRFYKRSADDTRITDEGDIVDIFTNLVLSMSPFPDDLQKLTKIKFALANTIALYKSTSKGSVVKKLINWLNLGSLKSESAKKDKIRSIVEKDIFPTATNKMDKITMLATMTARLLSYIVGDMPHTDKDMYSYRKFDPYGFEFARMFRTAFGHHINSIQKKVDDEHKNGTDMASVLVHYKDSVVTEEMMKPFKPQAAIKAGEKSRFETTQMLETVNHVDILNLLTKAHISIDSQTKSTKIRGVNPSQLHTIDTNFTPDNERCGLVKFKSLTMRITHNEPIGMQIKNLWDHKLVHKTRNSKDGIIYPVFINGIHRGYCTGKDAQITIAKSRRQKNYDKSPSNLLNPYTCAVFTNYGHLELFTDAGRPLIAVAFVEDGKLLMDTVMKNGVPYSKLFTEGKVGFSDLLAQGLVGYLDNYEEEYAIMKNSPKDLEIENSEKESYADEIEKLSSDYKKNKDEIELLTSKIDKINKYPVQYTTLHATAIIGVAIGLTIFPEHQQSCRTTYGGKFSFQSLCNSTSAGVHRQGKFSLYTSRPLVASAFHDNLGLKHKAIGNPANIVIATDKYNQEDAIIMSETYADSIKITRRYVISTYIDNKKDRLGKPSSGTVKNQKAYDHLTKDGLPPLGYRMFPSMCIIAKSSLDPDGKTYVNRSVFLDSHQEGIVQDIKMYPSTAKGKEGIMIVITLQVDRYPSAGDKFSIGGQKYTIGRIVPWYEMPILVGEHMPSIDIIINPHALPSRMTMGMLLEILLGRVSQITGLSYDGTAFEKNGEIKEAIYRILEENGYQPKGYVKMISPVTSRMLNGRFFSGLCHLLQLHHLTHEKTHGSGVGTIDGRGRRIDNDSNRLGEMEKDNMISHGAPIFAYERLSKYADMIQIPICTSCHREIHRLDSPCNYCGAEPTNFARIAITSLAQQLVRWSLARGTELKFHTVTNEVLIERLKKSVYRRIDNKQDNISERDGNSDTEDELSDEYYSNISDDEEESVTDSGEDEDDEDFLKDDYKDDDYEEIEDLD